MDYNIERLPNENSFRHLVRLSVDKLNGLHKVSWDDIAKTFQLDYSSDHLRKKAAGWKELIDNEEAESLNKEDMAYKESQEILTNGNHRSDKLLVMSAEQTKNVDYLLEAHGFDKNEWELVNAKNNIWNVYSKQDGVQSLYSSKITVKPKSVGFDMEKLLEVIGEKVEPVIIRNPKNDGKRLLEIPLFDMHFGIADFDYYLETYSKVIDKINSNEWDTILIVTGQDNLHNDNFTGQTTRGTVIEKVDMEKAWKDSERFFTGIIYEALKNSNNVDVIYSNGNHDQGMSYGFTKMLEAKFPEANFDCKMQQRKSYTWKNIFLGITHGDKGANRVSKNFLSEYGKDMAKATVVEIHMGHIHHEKAKDDFGIVLRSLATKAKTDEWHYDNGFVGSMKRFQLFEYSEDALESITYV